MSFNVVGDIIGGALDLLEGALTSKNVAKDISNIRFGDFVIVKTDYNMIVGLIGFLRFQTFGPIQPLGLPPEQRTAILPDIEDIVYGNTSKIATIPVLGYIEKGAIYHEIPPQLPNIHDPIFPMDTKTVKEFHQQTRSGLKMDYLSRMWRQKLPYPIDLFGRLYQNLRPVIGITAEVFLKNLEESYEEAYGEPTPACYAAALQHYLVE